MEKSILDFRHSLIILNISTALAVLLLIFGVSRFSVPAGAELDHVVVNIVPRASSLPLVVAKEAGFFSRNGLDVDFRRCTNDSAALEGLSQGAGVFATVSREAWSSTSAAGETGDLAVLASIAERQDQAEAVSPSVLPWLIVVARSAGDASPELSDRFFASLAEAERFIGEKRIASRMMLSDFMKEDLRGLDGELENIRFVVSRESHDTVAVAE